MELEVLRYTNRISSEAHREVSMAPACWGAVLAGAGVGSSTLLCGGARGWRPDRRLRTAAVPSASGAAGRPLWGKRHSDVFSPVPSGDRQGQPRLRHPPSGNSPAGRPTPGRVGLSFAEFPKFQLLFKGPLVLTHSPSTFSTDLR